MNRWAGGICSAIAVVAVVAVPEQGALAQPAADARVDARALFREGQEHFRNRRFALAADKFKAAYDKAQHADLLLNIAQAYRLAGNTRQALAYYERFLRNRPTDSAAADIRRIIGELKRQVVVAPAPTPPTPAVGDSAPTPASDRHGARDAPGRSVAVAPMTEPRRDASPGRRQRIWGLSLAGVGAVAVGAGVVFGVTARSRTTELNRLAAAYQDPNWTDDFLAAHQRRVDSAKAARRNMVISVVAGVIAIGSGGYLYVVGRRQAQRSRAVTISPSVSSTAVGTTLTGAF